MKLVLFSHYIKLEDYEEKIKYISIQTERRQREKYQ